MPLKSVEQAIADLARLDAANEAYATLQRAMNAVGEAVNGMSAERREPVFKEIEEHVMNWLSDGLPKIDLPEPEQSNTTAHRSTMPRTVYGTGATKAIVQYLAANGPSTPSQIYKAIDGTFQTKASDPNQLVRQLLHSMSKGKYARLTRKDGVYSVIPGREL